MVNVRRLREMNRVSFIAARAGPHRRLCERRSLRTVRLPDMELVSDLARWWLAAIMVCPGIPYPFWMIASRPWFCAFKSKSQNSRSTSPMSVEAREFAGLMTRVDDDVTSELLSSGATLTADHLRFMATPSRTRGANTCR